MAKEKSNQDNLNRRPISDWQVDRVRFTAFTLQSSPVADFNWWTLLTGEIPKTKTQRPRDGIIIEDGSISNGKLVVQSTPMRIDILIVPDEEKEPKGDFSQVIGNFTDSLDSFNELLLKWFSLETCPPLQRMAFGALLNLPVSDKESGYRQLSAYLPSVNIDAQNSSDFLYQINRPRLSSSSLRTLKINRLYKWSVAQIGKLDVILSDQPRVHFNPSFEPFNCRLELDISTQQDWNQQLPANVLPEIFSELSKIAKEIVENGDTP